VIDLLHKILGRIIRHLEYLYQDGIALSVYRNRYRLKRKGINYGRYKLYDKKWLHDLNIKTVIDIGANIGEFTIIYSELFEKATLYAFEPLPACYEKLSKRTSGINRIHVYECGLGDTIGEQSINLSSWHPASSFRSMDATHKVNYPHSADSVSVTVNINKLDNILSTKDMVGNVFIKMDVQGFEDEVIRGGRKIFAAAKVVVVECSFVQLYKDEPKFHGIYSQLVDLGYEYRGSLKQSVKSNDNSYLQADAIFIKTSEVS
jgi:FkbM family methyltransferase